MKLFALVVFALLCVGHAQEQQEDNEDASYEGLKGLSDPKPAKPQTAAANRTPKRRGRIDYNQDENDAPAKATKFQDKQKGGRRVSPKFNKKKQNQNTEYDDYAGGNNQAQEQDQAQVTTLF